MEKHYRSYLLALATAYAAETELALPTVSRRFHGADTFLDDFKAGRCSITLRKLDEMIILFKKLWPEGCEFPTDSLTEKKRPAKRSRK